MTVIQSTQTTPKKRHRLSRHARSASTAMRHGVVPVVDDESPLATAEASEQVRHGKSTGALMPTLSTGPPRVRHGRGLPSARIAAPAVAFLVSFLLRLFEVTFGHQQLPSPLSSVDHLPRSRVPPVRGWPTPPFRHARRGTHVRRRGRCLPGLLHARRSDLHSPASPSAALPRRALRLRPLDPPRHPRRPDPRSDRRVAALSTTRRRPRPGRLVSPRGRRQPARPRRRDRHRLPPTLTRALRSSALPIAAGPLVCSRTAPRWIGRKDRMGGRDASLPASSHPSHVETLTPLAC